MNVLLLFKQFWDWIAAGGEEAPDDMYRVTFGTGISDRNVHYSFTLYAWRDEPFTPAEVTALENTFNVHLSMWLHGQYPRKNYSFADWWGGPIVRTETNTLVDYDPEVEGNYSFEVNQQEEYFGALDV